MEVKQSSLAAVGTKFSQYPTDGRPEIAFAGKSNVGKSTLINAMLGRRALARTSSQPGKTRTINFYDVNGQMYVVDLPGYGYAKAPKTEIAKWGAMIEEYLQKREELKAIILLIDIRHEPGKNDVMMYEWLRHYGYDIIIAATKSDKINRSQIPKHLSVIRKTLGLQQGDVLIPFSGEKKTGVQELWTEIDRFLTPEEEN
ncbi:YihA family ribosome biogenesis GTP-binding protein [Anaerotignum lactatifermentans]|uniref:Probable GTP-binding protein EngB n=1 Tax=Anaerotignum lactatifermentans TaxID=160404 RepID=A0ABS2GD10_9FIRM|nr:ribosome biogenesis GTP-binding protein YihA/YsxC [Anaerotignum lactatifermentans]MBM6828595.1 YihA family ribosome biogenesis GTP-binding protein [Anaerotignum lactatifermentans]MBM6878533.1 YihA family ribosome biogenesis GTP-binding protein [Anaerotignum lactatifermentans]MBM6950177.1 YihA family ribosome biogenesis GTP-binding protein [Anaerotignum lactatifermentans]